MTLSISDVQFVVCEPGARSMWTYAKTESEAQEIADNRYLATGKPYVVETWEEFDKRTTQAWLDDFPLQEITEDFYYEMLNCLPPMHRVGAPGFFMCEYTAGSITSQFVRIGFDLREARYYGASVDMSNPDTWITAEKIAALPEGPRLEWFNKEEGSAAA
jgi:hypothetical protein